MDKNSDGKTQSEELLGLSKAGISSISLNNVLMTTMKNTLPFLKSNNDRVFNGLI